MALVVAPAADDTDDFAVLATVEASILAKLHADEADEKDLYEQRAPASAKARRRRSSADAKRPPRDAGGRVGCGRGRQRERGTRRRPTSAGNGRDATEKDRTKKNRLSHGWAWASRFAAATPAAGAHEYFCEPRGGSGLAARGFAAWPPFALRGVQKKGTHESIPPLPRRTMRHNAPRYNKV